METSLRIFREAKKYWVHLIAALLSLIVSTAAGFYTPWALRELTKLATEGTADFGKEALRIGDRKSTRLNSSH